MLKLRHMETQGEHIKGVLPWLVRCAHRASTRDFCPALAALVSSVQNIFSYGHYFTSFVPVAQQAGQAVVPHHLSLSVSGGVLLPTKENTC
jgi:hypothetical protein